MLGGVERDRVLGGIRDPVLDPFHCHEIASTLYTIVFEHHWESGTVY